MKQDINPECENCGLLKSTVEDLAPFGPDCEKGKRHKFPPQPNQERKVKDGQLLGVIPKGKISFDDESPTNQEGKEEELKERCLFCEKTYEEHTGLIPEGSKPPRCLNSGSKFLTRCFTDPTPTQKETPEGWERPTVEEVERWLEKLETLTSRGAKLVHVKNLLTQAKEEGIKEAWKTVENRKRFWEHWQEELRAEGRAEVIAELKEKFKEGLRMGTYIGGESHLHRDTIKEILSSLKEPKENA